jgi:hypothetical protein
VQEECGFWDGGADIVIIIIIATIPHRPNEMGTNWAAGARPVLASFVSVRNCRQLPGEATVLHEFLS